MTDLTTTYLGLVLDCPIIASASPATRNLDSLRELEDAGIGAVVLPSLFEEEVLAEESALHEALERGSESFAESLSYFPTSHLGPHGPDRLLELVEAAKEALSIPVIASLNATAPGSWSKYATAMVEAGADAIELNIYALATDPYRTAADVEAAYLDTIRQVRAAVPVPLAVKLSPYFSSLPHFAAAAVTAGADGLVLFNRFYQPDIDVETLAVRPRVDLSQPPELRLPLRWLGILRPQLPRTSLAATTGVYDGEDVLKALLVGADVAAMASALLRHGTQQVTHALAGLREWLREQDYESVDQLRGSMSASTASDAAAFERSQYVNTLLSYRPARQW